MEEQNPGLKGLTSMKTISFVFTILLLGDDICKYVGVRSAVKKTTALVV